MAEKAYAIAVALSGSTSQCSGAGGSVDDPGAICTECMNRPPRVRNGRVSDFRNKNRYSAHPMLIFVVVADKDKWNEQGLRIGETIAPEKTIVAPHRGSSMQRLQGGDALSAVWTLVRTCSVLQTKEAIASGLYMEHDASIVVHVLPGPSPVFPSSRRVWLVRR